MINKGDGSTEEKQSNSSQKRMCRESETVNEILSTVLYSN